MAEDATHALMAIMDNPLFLQKNSHDDVGIGLRKRIATDFLSSSEPCHAPSLLPRAVMTNELMDFGAHMHRLMSDLFSRK